MLSFIIFMLKNERRFSVSFLESPCILEIRNNLKNELLGVEQIKKKTYNFFHQPVCFCNVTCFMKCDTGRCLKTTCTLGFTALGILNVAHKQIQASL